MLHEGLKEIGEITTISAMSDDERNANVRANCQKISKRLMDQQPAHDRKAILVCYGPSIRHTLPAIRSAYENELDIITVSGAHRFLIENGIIPTIHIDCDPRLRKAIQFGKPHKKVKYWMGSCVDPVYIEILEDNDVTLWHNHNGYESENCVWDIDPDGWLLIGGGSVGLRAISLLYSQGYRDFEIHGMDCSFTESKETHAGEHLGKKQETINVFCKDRWFVSSASFIDYARQFNSDLRLWPDARFVLHGDGLLQHMQRS